LDRSSQFKLTRKIHDSSHEIMITLYKVDKKKYIETLNQLNIGERSWKKSIKIIIKKPESTKVNLSNYEA
jgi:hypothetical protein